jgi:SAM-dependent methyltransferase
MAGEFVLLARDRERSYSSRMLPAVRAALDRIPRLPPKARYLDIGCGYGGLSLWIARHLGVIDVHGLDLDDRAVEGARSAGVDAITWDLGTLPLPYDSETFDLITLMGVLDYLPTFDATVREVRRLLTADGHVVVSLPNLASWHNRLGLALGFQPRDLEVSSERLVGVHSRYRSDPPVGHISAVTTAGFVELMTYHGFQCVGLFGAAPQFRTGVPGAVRMIDALARRHAYWARRFVYVGRRTDARAETDTPPRGWWVGGSRPDDADE